MVNKMGLTIPSATSQKETTVPGQTSERIDNELIRYVMGAVIGCTTMMTVVTGWPMGPVLSVITILLLLVVVAGTLKFNIDFRRNQPLEISGFFTLGLSSLAFACGVAIIQKSLNQTLANPTFVDSIILISGVVICSAPLTVLWVSARNWVSKRANTGSGGRRER